MWKITEKLELSQHQANRLDKWVKKYLFSDKKTWKQHKPEGK